ncbi:MAG: MFS transporter, partial [Legionellales bacterium]|nr:MFS transporter [Legionellales bacterium]
MLYSIFSSSFVESIILNKSPSHFRWFVIGISFIAIFFSYLDRNALSFAIRPLEQQFHLNNEDFGMIAAAFGVGYFIFTAIGGFLADHYGSRRIWTLCAFFWSIMCMMFGGVGSFFALFTLRLMLGVAESPTFPCFVRAATNWLPDVERGRALALGLIAVPLSSAIGSPVLSLLVTYIGWRWMFVFLGLATLIWAFCWYWQYRDSPAESAYISAEELDYIRKNQHLDAGAALPKFEWRSVLTNPTLISNNYAFFCFGYLLFFGSAWLPGYLIQTYHIALNKAGFLLSVPWFTATVLVLIGG